MFSQLKEFGVGACSGGGEYEGVIVDAVDEEPVGGDVAFAMAAVVTGQRVIAHRLGKDFSSQERVKSHCELGGVATLSFDALGSFLNWAVKKTSYMD